MIVRDIMSKNITWVNEHDTVEKAAELMKSCDCGCIPVCNEDKLIGVVTDRDIALRSVAEGQSPHQRVRDVMSKDLVIGSPEMNVNDAVKIMGEKQIRRLPIVENDSLVGIVALGDISLEPVLQDNAEDALKNISKP
ncbi:CBS domain-containing protein [Mobilisporobacter senegalensis]|uniref:CBS domain-containing protein n=1 Tax=Mobilisporobacter senegalensis TaxID=1329262 RepID=A0A3N1XKL9_9FIRM|nr:CBS domain-containing protein [Mobilisporobacter senegalensis]ROR27255.1 CBS domain-containing protein [Mobilisporobacter senegalensis]